MGPIWDRQDPGGPYVRPMNFAIWGPITALLYDAKGDTSRKPGCWHTIITQYKIFKVISTCLKLSLFWKQVWIVCIYMRTYRHNTASMRTNIRVYKNTYMNALCLYDYMFIGIEIYITRTWLIAIIFIWIPHGPWKVADGNREKKIFTNLKLCTFCLYFCLFIRVCGVFKKI